jgi:hypothetical protein
VTDDEKDAALASWPNPVYTEDRKPGSLEDFAICKHCNQIRMQHVDNQCLFDATTFEVKRSPVVAPRHCSCTNGCKSATCDKL